MRKLSKQPIPALKRKVDRALQDFYRLTPTPCEVCGRPAELRHHFVEKSQSSYLRYHPKNLIPLCHHCHFRHHRTGDPEIVATIILKRGKRWYKWIQENRRKYQDLNRKFLEQELKKWT